MKKMIEVNNLRKDLFDSERCRDCREERIEFQLREMKHHGLYCPFQPGISTLDIDNSINMEKIDVMFLLKTHSGGEWRKDEPLETTIQHDVNYYFIDTIEGFHQFIMRKLLKRLNKDKITWYKTDTVKCYVDNGKGNFFKAFNHCQTYLNLQIVFLRPKVVVRFGREVQRHTKTMFMIPFPQGEIKIIDFPFPSANAADSWAIAGGLDEIHRKIKLNLEN